VRLARVIARGWLGSEGINMEFVDKIVAFVQRIISIGGINKGARLAFFTEGKR